MDLEYDNTEFFNSTNKTGEYTTNLETLKSKLPAILADFQQYYILNEQNKTDDNVSQMFENIKVNMTKLNSDLFSLSNNVETGVNKINQDLMELNELIREEKQNNRDLKKKLGIVENKSNASTELISDYKEMYNYVYLKNWGLFFSIVIAGIAISKVFTNNNVNPKIVV
jgi:hypothetical protein